MTTYSIVQLVPVPTLLTIQYYNSYTCSMYKAMVIADMHAYKKERV